ncbi:MAG: hypothetical protein V4568_00555, partial [Pseudomonadota bacterium]
EPRTRLASIGFAMSNSRYQELTDWTAPTINEDGQKVSEQCREIVGRRYRRIRVELVEST